MKTAVVKQIFVILRKICWERNLLFNQLLLLSRKKTRIQSLLAHCWLLRCDSEKMTELLVLFKCSASFFRKNLKSLVDEKIQLWLISWLLQHKKCPYSELFWSVFSHIRTEYGKILHFSPYSVRMWKNTDQNNSEYGHSEIQKNVNLISSSLWCHQNYLFKIR